MLKLFNKQSVDWLNLKINQPTIKNKPKQQKINQFC